MGPATAPAAAWAAKWRAGSASAARSGEEQGENKVAKSSTGACCIARCAAAPKVDPDNIYVAEVAIPPAQRVACRPLTHRQHALSGSACPPRGPKSYLLTVSNVSASSFRTHSARPSRQSFVCDMRRATDTLFVSIVPQKWGCARDSRKRSRTNSVA